MDPKFGLFWILLAAFLASPINCASADVSTIEEPKDIPSAESEENPVLLDDENILNAGESDNTNIKISGVESQEKLIQTEDDSASPTPDVEKMANYSEAYDMKYGGLFENLTIFTDSQPIDEPPSEPIEESSAEEVIISDPIPSNLKYNVEWIETRDENTIDVDDVHSQPLHITTTWPWIVTMTAVGTMFVLFLIGSVSFYRLLTRRYNNRRMLIDEEDMIDPNDMKHFSL